MHTQVELNRAIYSSKVGVQEAGPQQQGRGQSLGVEPVHPLQAQIRSCSSKMCPYPLSQWGSWVKTGSMGWGAQTPGPSQLGEEVASQAAGESGAVGFHVEDFHHPVFHHHRESMGISGVRAEGGSPDPSPTPQSTPTSQRSPKPSTTPLSPPAIGNPPQGPSKLGDPKAVKGTLQTLGSHPVFSYHPPSQLPPAAMLHAGKGGCRHMYKGDLFWGHLTF